MTGRAKTAQKILVVGGGIGGLTFACALAGPGFDVRVIEKYSARAVDGVGIIQQSNVVRAMASIGLVEQYIDAGFPYYWSELYAPDGSLIVRMPLEPAVAGFPPSLGIGRRALRDVLHQTATARGATIREGTTVEHLQDDGNGVEVGFSEGSSDRFDVVVGADGIYSQMRDLIFPQAIGPQFTGQSVWRYSLPRPAGFDAVQIYTGAKGLGLVPVSDSEVYLFITTPEPGNPQFPRQGLAALMRERLAGSAPAIMDLAAQITDDDAVVYRPLEAAFLPGDWHQGRLVLLGDAVHAMTPHLGQGGGMAIEDAVVLAEELRCGGPPARAFSAYQQRRAERCRVVYDTSLAICRAQLGQTPPVDQRDSSATVQAVLARPI